MDFRSFEDADTFKQFSDEQRKKLAGEGKAMPDGSFPVESRSDLQNAITAIGRAKSNAASTVKTFLKRRARALDAADLIPEGWTQESDYVVAFAVDGSGQSGVSKPFEVLRVGEFKRGSRSVPVTSADLDTAVANFNRWKALGQEIPVDYDHAFSEGREAPAAGWYTSLERRGDALWATVRWTSKARDEIASGQYRFFSPEFAREWHSETGEAEGFTIIAGALTNRPFLRGMTPVALNQEIDAEIVRFAIDALQQVSGEQREGVADTSGEVADKPKAQNEIETFKVEIDGEEKELTADEVVALHQKAAKADEAEETAKKAKAEAAASKAASETLSTRVETLEQDAKDRDFKELFSEVGLNPGRFKADEETEKTWRETFDALGRDRTKSLMEQVPPETIPLTQQGRAGQPEQDAAPSHMDAESFKMNQRVETYMAEHPDVDFNTALERVRSEAGAAA